MSIRCLSKLSALNETIHINVILTILNRFNRFEQFMLIGLDFRYLGNKVNLLVKTLT